MDLVLINKIAITLIIPIGLWLAFWVYFADRKNKINQTFFVFVFTAVIWMSLDFATSFPSLLPYALLMARIEWAFISVCIVFAYFLSVYFPRESKRSPVLDKTVIGIGIIFFLLSLFTSTVIKSIEIHHLGGARYVLGMGGITFLIIMIPFAIVVLLNIFKKYFTLSRSEKIRTQYFLVGLSIYVIANLIFNIGLMLFIREYPIALTYLGTFSGILFFGFTAYAIVKKELFDIKVALTSVFVSIIAILLFVDMFLFTDILWIRALKGFTLFVFLIAGYLLIKSVLREIKQREVIAKMAEGLEIKVQERTGELQKKVEQLEKTNRLIVGRELKMVDLKKSVRDLEKRLEEHGEESEEK